MNGRSAARGLAASPTMVGAITTLIIVVAVFLAYNANNGLPFVPVYRVSAEMCNAGRLAPNNEVRIGGNRVGVIESIEPVELDGPTPCLTGIGGGGQKEQATTVAKLNLKLDDTAKPLPEDSIVRVRYRSSFGLKYLEIERGQGDGVPEGATLPLPETEQELAESQQTEFDDIGNTFDTPTREASRKVLEGFGDAFAARGASLNQAIEALNPLFANLAPVSKALSDPTTQLVRFFPELADAARIVAPVSEDNAQFFTNAGIAFGAISSDEGALRETISEGPPTLETGIESLPPQVPFLRDFAAFSHLLRPGVRDLRISLPVLNDAIATGAKTLPKTVRMNQDLEDAMVELENLVDEPSTKVTLVRLGDFFDEANSAAQYIVPYQNVCNYWNYWFQYLTDHFASQDQFGSAERLIGPGYPGTGTVDNWPRNPLNTTSGSQADGRRSDTASLDPSANAPGIFDPLPANDPGSGDGAADTQSQPILHGGPYGPSGTEAAPNCQAGQFGFPLGQVLIPGQGKDNPVFGPSNVAAATGTKPFGRTDLFLTQDGTRVFWDSP
jgi:ABC-type transporter Mla subunit MlaD